MAISDIFDAILAFDAEGVKKWTEAEIGAGTDLDTLLNQGMIAAMDEVGRRFSIGDLYVPEMLRAAQSMKAGLEILKPHLSSDSAQSRGTIIIGTVKGDLHDIGKNLVAMMMEGAGFKVIDLGVNVEPGRFIQAVTDNQAQLVALSALLSTTMPAMETTITAIKKSGIVVKSIIGGAPVTQAFADKIGADGYSSDAPGAVELARSLL